MQRPPFLSACSLLAPRPPLARSQDWNGQIPMPAVLKPRPLWTGKQVRRGRHGVSGRAGRALGRASSSQGPCSKQGLQTSQRRRVWLAARASCTVREKGMELSQNPSTLPGLR